MALCWSNKTLESKAQSQIKMHFIIIEIHSNFIFFFKNNYMFFKFSK